MSNPAEPIVMPVSPEGIRTAFEVWVTSSPYEESSERYPNDPTKYGWPGNYKDIRVDMCWQAWKSACELIQGAARVEPELQVSDSSLLPNPQGRV